MAAAASIVRHESGLRVLALAVACATILSGCVSAASQTQFMPLGHATMAPQGFLQFCAREPQQCGASPTPSRGDTEKQMMQKQWAAIFAPSTATSQPPPQPVLVEVGAAGASQAAVHEAGADTPTFLQAALRDPPETERYDWTPIFGAAAGREARPAFAAPNLISSLLLHDLSEDGGAAAASSPAAMSPTFETVSTQAPPLGPSFLRTAHEAATFSAAPYLLAPSVVAMTATSHTVDATPLGPTQPLRLDIELMKQLTDINTRVNSAITPATDLEAFGANDVWTLPLEDGGPARGNCKHYALEKQRALTLAGLPAANLSLAIVRTRWGELHAVLLVRTDQGELVLDNLTPSIRSWRDVDYTWIERQKPDEPLVWVALAAAGSGSG